jgi:hypothetical protein
MCISLPVPNVVERITVKIGQFIVVKAEVHGFELF